MNEIMRLSISFSGNNAENKEIDLYDVSQALIGFHRSLALTTHLVLNNQIITQAPSLKGAQILALPAEIGSWKMTAVIVVGAASALYQLGTAPHDTPIGHLVYSAYDYVVSESLGFHVDYEKSILEQYEELKKKELSTQILQQYRFDSLTEKCIRPIIDMHRPIYAKKTALKCTIEAEFDNQKHKVANDLTQETYEYISYTETSEYPVDVYGRVSSYNSNTFKGRIYVADEVRPIPFTLTSEAKTDHSVSLIANSLHANTQRNSLKSDEGFIHCKSFKNKSKSGMLKSLNIVDVSTSSFN